MYLHSCYLVRRQRLQCNLVTSSCTQFQVFIKKQIPAATWPAQSPDLTVTENMRHIIKRKLQSENDIVKTQAELINALQLQDLEVAANWIYSKSVRIHSTLAKFSIVRKGLSHNVLTIKGNIGSFSCEKL